MTKLLKISEFAHLSGITRKNLIYYDEIGLLSPEQVRENGYRYYSYRQLETVSVIGSLQEVGMSLSEIKRHLDERTPESLIELFTIQRKNIEEKIDRLWRIEAMIDTRLGATRRALEADKDFIGVKRCSEELLFAGAEIRCGDTQEELENVAKEFYDFCDQEKVTYGYAVGEIIAKQTLLKGEWHYPMCYFCKVPKNEGTHPLFIKPAGLYLIGFETVSYDGPEKLYEKLFKYIKDNDLTIVGNSYEEFLLDEIAVKNPNGYLVQVSIQVKKNKTGV